ncbi:hypothetical protein NKG05_22980 [Oerskovia sp. M15]
MTGPRRKGLAVAALSVLLLVAAGGVALDPAALGTGTGASPTEAGASGSVAPRVARRPSRSRPATCASSPTRSRCPPETPWCSW